MNILGLNAFHGDASAALVADGKLVSAVEEERFNRIKHWAGFPTLAARWCLTDAGDLQHVAISRDPYSHFWSKIGRIARRPGNLRRVLSRAQNTVHVSQLAQRLKAVGLANTDRVRVHFVEHHRAHLASAFFASPFEEAAVISIDGFGDFSSVMWGVGRGNRLEIRGSVQFPHSLGLYYTAFTQLLGFPNYGDEYKMMGLSAYGDRHLMNEVRNVVRTTGDQVRLNLDYFTHHTIGAEMTWDNCAPKLGIVYSRKMTETFGSLRGRHDEIEQRHMDLAASVQGVLEENFFELLTFVQRQTRQKTVCLAGGVALNCVANGMIFERTDFRDVYIQPASHDAGTSIGAALFVQHEILNQPRSFVMRDVYCGPEYSDTEIQRDLELAGCTFHRLAENDLVARTAEQIANGQIIGWFQGRMEFGPRALGNRSILADPRRKDMKDILNSRIKYREPFRPFCPSILADRVDEYFETNYPSPFMVMAYKIRPEKQESVPAITHGDGTGRLQTVEESVNPRYWKLIRKFDELTGVPVLLNTSFNENEPIVNTPAEAINCFLRTRMDVLSIGSYVLYKVENAHLGEDRSTFSDSAPFL